MNVNTLKFLYIFQYFTNTRNATEKMQKLFRMIENIFMNLTLKNASLLLIYLEVNLKDKAVIGCTFLSFRVGYNKLEAFVISPVAP